MKYNLNGYDLLLLWLRSLYYRNKDISNHLGISYGYTRQLFFKMKRKVVE